MYRVVIGNSEYTEIKNVDFDVTVDFINTNLPINEFTVDIKTSDLIPTGVFCYLYNKNTLWAKYIISDVQHSETEFYKVTAKSVLALLDTQMLEPVMFSGETAGNIIDNLFAATETSLGETLHEVSFEQPGRTISGYCPAQSAKERLQWVCFYRGAVVETVFTDKVYITDAKTPNAYAYPTQKVFQNSEIFWRPTVVYQNAVTKIILSEYSFSSILSPTVAEEWVEVNGAYWRVNKDQIEIGSDDSNTVVFDNIMLVAFGDPLTMYLSQRLHRLMSSINIKADVLFDDAIKVGEPCFIPVNNQMYGGIIESATLKAGNKGRASITITGCSQVNSGKIKIDYISNLTPIKSDEYLYPTNYIYSIKVAPFWAYTSSQRLLYRYVDNAEDVVDGTISGTTPADGVTDTRTAECKVAIDIYEETAKINIVDSISFLNGVVKIG